MSNLANRISKVEKQMGGRRGEPPILRAQRESRLFAGLRDLAAANDWADATSVGRSYLLTAAIASCSTDGILP